MSVMANIGCCSLLVCKNISMVYSILHKYGWKKSVIQEPNGCISIINVNMVKMIDFLSNTAWVTFAIMAAKQISRNDFVFESHISTAINSKTFTIRHVSVKRPCFCTIIMTALNH